MTLTAPSVTTAALPARRRCVYRVQGGCRLSGTVDIRGAKNAALPVLAATLLTQDPCVLENVPDIRDVRTMLEVLRHLGARVEWIRPGSVLVEAADIRSRTTPDELATRLRASFLVMGTPSSKWDKHPARRPRNSRLSAGMVVERDAKCEGRPKKGETA